MSGGSIHFLSKDLINSQTFLADGTFTVPAGINEVILFGYGGGGGGASGQNIGGVGGGGGHGAEPSWRIVSVTPGDIITVDIGAGGAGNTNDGNSGSNGGDTLFGSEAFRGAQGGYGYQALNGNGSPTIAPGGGTKGGDPAVATGATVVDGNRGQGNSYFKTGAAGGTASGASSAGGGGGGSGITANGGVGGDASPGDSDNGADAAANSGAGGGGGGATGSVESDGGDGGSGRLIVYWLAPV